MHPGDPLIFYLDTDPLSQQLAELHRQIEGSRLSQGLEPACNEFPTSWLLQTACNLGVRGLEQRIASFEKPNDLDHDTSRTTLLRDIIPRPEPGYDTQDQHTYITLRHEATSHIATGPSDCAWDGTFRDYLPRFLIPFSSFLLPPLSSSLAPFPHNLSDALFLSLPSPSHACKPCRASVSPPPLPGRAPSQETGTGGGLTLRLVGGKNDGTSNASCNLWPTSDKGKCVVPKEAINAGGI